MRSIAALAVFGLVCALCWRNVEKRQRPTMVLLRLGTAVFMIYAVAVMLVIARG